MSIFTLFLASSYFHFYYSVFAKLASKYKIPLFKFFSYALFNSRRNLSAIMAINSELVGFPFAAEIV